MAGIDGRPPFPALKTRLEVDGLALHHVGEGSEGKVGRLDDELRLRLTKAPSKRIFGHEGPRLRMRLKRSRDPFTR